MFMGPMGGVGPLPPSVSISELNLFHIEDENIIASSWIDDLGNKQKDFDDKLVFYNNEDILNSRITLNHFSKKHKSKFLEHNIEFLSKKGQYNTINQDNVSWCYGLIINRTLNITARTTESHPLYRP